jgi:hypothetical protein
MYSSSPPQSVKYSSLNLAFWSSSSKLLLYSINVDDVTAPKDLLQNPLHDKQVPLSSKLIQFMV